MAILDILEISRQGMNANRQSLQTTSNNIANANTPGYSRQRAVQQNHPSHFVHGVGYGGGVDIKTIARSHDEFVERQLHDEYKTHGNLKMRSAHMQQIEGVLQNETQRMGDLLNNFFNDVRTLSTSPEVPALRANVLRSAENTAAGFRKVSDSLDTMKISIDEKLKFQVAEVNRMTAEIVKLNEDILHLQSVGQEPNELLDRREMILRDLSQKIDFDTWEDQSGRVSVLVGGFGVLVQGGERQQLSFEPTPSRALKSPGNIDIFLRSSSGERPITDLIKGGEIGGLLHVRDKALSPALEHLDKLAYEFANSVNAAHEKGVGLDGESGRGFFKQLNEAKDAAHNLELSEDMLKNPHAIATGEFGAVGENTVMLAIADIQNTKLMPRFMHPPDGPNNLEQTQTLNESMTNLVGEIGVQTRGDEQLAAHQDAIITQLENYRESISGVSLEEEAVNMIQFQAVFNATAKALKMGDELMQTVLSLKP